MTCTSIFKQEVKAVVESRSIPTKLEFQTDAFFAALMQDAKRVLERVPPPEIGKLGNSKIHARGLKALTLVYSGTAFHDCFPTSGCGVCYAQGFRYLSAAAKRHGSSWVYSYLARNEIQVLKNIILSEIRAALKQARMLGLRLAVRIHEAGDFFSIEQITMWEEIARQNPDVIFWAYTRSDLVPQLTQALQCLASVENVHLRASFDPTMSADDVTLSRNGMPGAVVVGRKHNGKRTGPDRVAGTVNCPEQLTDSKIGCADCGLCWNENRPNIRFWKH
jgi:hypothetical protein